MGGIAVSFPGKQVAAKGLHCDGGDYRGPCGEEEPSGVEEKRVTHNLLSGSWSACFVILRSAENRATDPFRSRVIGKQGREADRKKPAPRRPLRTLEWSLKPGSSNPLDSFCAPS